MDKPRRTGAGKKSLSADFIWPDNFAGGVQEISSVPDLRPKSNVAPARSEQSQTKKSMSSPCSCSSSDDVISVQRKMLELEQTKKRQELEKQKIEIENSIKLLEHELQEAELKASSKKSHRTSRKTASKSSLPQLPRANYTSTIAEWLEDNEKTQNDLGNVAVINEPHANLENMGVNSEPQQNNDMKILCQTLVNALSSKSATNTEKFIARQTIDKDFPYFDGKPEEWPLFYCQFNNIVSLGNYSQAEIMTKLQKCLKGEAKASVAGMLLTPDNVDLVINSLKMRFGRPDQIIEVLIDKIKVIPFIKEHNLGKLIQFSNEVNNLVATMKTLNSVGHMNNPQLLKDLLTKLPDILKLKWGEEVAMKRGAIDLQDFNNWVSKLAVAASYTGGGEKVTEKNDHKISYGKATKTGKSPQHYRYISRQYKTM